MEKYLECAMIVGTHGVKGTVRLENRCDSPAVLASLKTVYTKSPDGAVKAHAVIHASVQKNMVLASIDGIGSVEEAAAWKGTVLYADRADFKLKKGAHFIADLIGLNVIDAESGEIHGTVEDVISPAGRMIYVVKKPDGKTFMIPAVDEFVKKAVADGGDGDGIYVTLIEGMKD